MCQPAAVAQAKMRFPSEIALLIGLVGNSFAVAILAKSNLGLTTTSLFSYVLSKAVPAVSLGTWSYLLQIAMMIGLAVYIRRVKIGYALSFVLAILFGLLVDFFSFVVAPLPSMLSIRIVYYLVGTGMLVVGISFFIRSRLPALPVDTFTRDLTAYLRIPFKKVRTTLDVICLVLSVGVGLLAVHALPGIGIGTVLSTFLVGTLVGRLSAMLDKHLEFAPALRSADRLIEE